MSDNQDDLQLTPDQLGEEAALPLDIEEPYLPEDDDLAADLDSDDFESGDDYEE
jgi:hypothetical protein